MSLENASRGPRRRRAWFAALATLGCGFGLALHAAVTTPAELAAELRQQLARTAAPGALWGVKVVALKSGQTLFETNAGRLFVPASNTKLFTAALALDRLGPTRQLVTSLRVPAKAGGPVIRGDLLVVGAGDPMFTERLHNGNWEKAFAPLVETVVAAGIKRVEGDLVCDTSLFRGAPYGSGWNWDDLGFDYGAAVSALSANDNVTRLILTPGATSGAPVTARLEPIPDLLAVINDVTTAPTDAARSLRWERLPGEERVFVSGRLPAGGGAVTEEITVPSPARYFGDLLKLALSRRGVDITGPVRELGWRERRQRPLKLDEWRPLGTVPSPPMSEIVRAMMKPSQNLYAHTLWLLVGSETERFPKDDEAGWPSAETTEDAGQRALRAFLGRAGVNTNEVAFEEGSGLSRKNLVTPAALVQLLAFMNRHPARDAWRDSLPIAGVDGTLRNRFKESPARGKVQAKTGTLRHVSSLAGYVETGGGETLAFSILVNGYVPTRPGATAPQETDRLAEIVTRFASPAN